MINSNWKEKSCLKKMQLNWNPWGCDNSIGVGYEVKIPLCRLAFNIRLLREEEK